MRWYEAVFYGILQGLSEFLPISSSGHLALAQEFFGSELDPEQRLGFEVLLHLATLLAVVFVYRKDVLSLIKGFCTLVAKIFKGKARWELFDQNERLALCTIVATIALIPAGFLDGALGALSSSLLVVGICLIINSVILWFSDVLGRGSKDISKMTPKNALFAGICQLLALMPGISRSGTTVTGMLWQDFDRQSAVKFSFIMSIPAILGACVFELPEFFTAGVSQKELDVYAIGALCALLTAVLAMKLLTYISKKSNFRIFSYYCMALGAIIVVRALL